MPKEGFTQVTIADALKGKLKCAAEAEGLSMPGLIKKMLGDEDNVDRLLEIIDKHLVHHGSQSKIHYLRGYIKGVEWTKTEIMKVFER